MKPEFRTAVEFPAPVPASGEPNVPLSPSGIYYPSGTEIIGVDRKQKATLVILGRSGCGKSHLGRQLLLDPDYGKEEVLFLMAEDSTQTYGVEGIHTRRVETFMQALEVAEELARATAAGKRLPKVIFVDSFSGMGDYTRQKVRKSDDVRGGFGDLGYGGMDVALTLRDKVNADIVILVTTYEGAFNTTPEIAVEGKLLPKNITRLSGSTFYMKAIPVSFDPKEVKPLPASHRTIATGEDGKLYIDEKGMGRVINRYFFTVDSGEVMAKAHRTVNFQERAILPDVLRKIHGIDKEGK